ncbi:hypothetical protein HPB47_009207 [Ixodes persulcatus]|uniref:Uncharacterized protein n=1 Tax=Ixodes persulcatus TaxID=34615 RepID=A0AC60P2J7_IXOPE|nr:hypothetical protein HPB47_009207 [Ixodes persulcatus]
MRVSDGVKLVFHYVDDILIIYPGTIKVEAILPYFHEAGGDLRFKRKDPSSEAFCNFEAATDQDDARRSSDVQGELSGRAMRVPDSKPSDSRRARGPSSGLELWARELPHPTEPSTERGAGERT